MQKGIVQEIQIVETKYSANSLGQLSNGQMEMKWIKDQAQKLKELEGPHKTTGDLIQQNLDKIKRIFISVNKEGKITDLSNKIKN